MEHGCRGIGAVSWGRFGTVRDGDGNAEIHNLPGDPYAVPNQGLEKFSRDQMRSSPVFLNKNHAKLILTQIQETTAYRNWRLFAVAVMSCHIHVVVAVIDDPSPSDILRDFKSYCSRRLNSLESQSTAGKWWTTSGSTRKLSTERAIVAAVEYVKHQSKPLVVWIDEQNENDPKHN